jgi:hypothetical protein
MPETARPERIAAQSRAPRRRLAARAVGAGGRGRPAWAAGRVLGALAVASALGLGLPARAAEAKKAKKVIRLEQITVEGRIQKPQAFYILQRSNLNFDELERTESFLPKTVKSVDKDPF